MDTATIIPTRVVKTARIAGRTVALPEGTTDVNATKAVEKFVKSENWTWGFAGPADDSVIVVVQFWDFTSDCWARVTKRLSFIVNSLHKDVEKS